MYKLAEFRKKLEQNKPSSLVEEDCPCCNGTGREFFGLLSCSCCFYDRLYNTGSHEESAEDEVKPIRDMMKRVNEMYSKPR